MMTMIKIAALENGAHRNQTLHGSLPDGWAVVPVDPKTLQNFPFGNFAVEEVDGVPHMIAESWEPISLPENADSLTPAQLRENAYNTEAIIEWDGEMITVTEASTKWQYYAAEGSDKAEELTTLILIAKSSIREKYPDIQGV